MSQPTLEAGKYYTTKSGITVWVDYVVPDNIEPNSFDEDRLAIGWDVLDKTLLHWTRDGRFNRKKSSSPLDIVIGETKEKDL